MNWDNYDKWRLSTPYDDEFEVEYFVTQKYEYYSFDEDDINHFDDRIEEVEKNAIKLEVDLKDAADELAEELNLHKCKYDMIADREEYERSEREYAMERKYDEMRGK